MGIWERIKGWFTLPIEPVVEPEPEPIPEPEPDLFFWDCDGLKLPHFCKRGYDILYVDFEQALAWFDGRPEACEGFERAWLLHLLGGQRLRDKDPRDAVGVILEYLKTQYPQFSRFQIK